MALLPLSCSLKLSLVLLVAELSRSGILGYPSHNLPHEDSTIALTREKRSGLASMTEGSLKEVAHETPFAFLNVALNRRRRSPGAEEMAGKAEEAKQAGSAGAEAAKAQAESAGSGDPKEKIGEGKDQAAAGAEAAKEGGKAKAEEAKNKMAGGAPPMGRKKRSPMVIEPNASAHLREVQEDQGLSREKRYNKGKKGKCG